MDVNLSSASTSPLWMMEQRGRLNALVPVLRDSLRCRGTDGRPPLLSRLAPSVAPVQRRVSLNLRLSISNWSENHGDCLLNCPVRCSTRLSSTVGCCSDLARVDEIRHSRASLRSWVLPVPMKDAGSGPRGSPLDSGRDSQRTEGLKWDAQLFSELVVRSGAWC
jgi:hypothetical protein